MHIAQPAFSEQIRRLEAELGARLFDRTSHYVRLTEAGNLFLSEIRPALQQVDHAAAVAGRAGRGVFGTLRVGLAAAAVSELTPLILREFAARCPDVAVELRDFGFVDPSAGLAARDVDVAIVRLPLPAQQELEVVPLLDEPRVVVLAEDHPLADSILLTPDELRDDPVVAGPRPVAIRVRDATEPHANTLESWLSLIAAGRGIGVAPASTARLHARPGLRFVALAGVADTTLAIAHWPEVSAPAVREFVGLARSVAQDVGGAAEPAAEPRRRTKKGDREAVSHETDFVVVGTGRRGQD
jgi:DNA-binding transcriptional LysR family regulator